MWHTFVDRQLCGFVISYLTPSCRLLPPPPPIGPVYKLAFGPRSFIVVSDPVMAKHVLKSSVGAYDKGVLATVRGYA